MNTEAKPGALRRMMAAVIGQTTKAYTIGPRTMELLFHPARITNVSNMQLVFDELELLLEGIAMEEEKQYAKAKAIDAELKDVHAELASLRAERPAPATAPLAASYDIETLNEVSIASAPADSLPVQEGDVIVTAAAKPAPLDVRAMEVRQLVLQLRHHYNQARESGMEIPALFMAAEMIEVQADEAAVNLIKDGERAEELRGLREEIEVLRHAAGRMRCSLADARLQRARSGEEPWPQ